MNMDQCKVAAENNVRALINRHSILNAKDEAHLIRRLIIDDHKMHWWNAMLFWHRVIEILENEEFIFWNSIHQKMKPSDPNKIVQITMVCQNTL